MATSLPISSTTEAANPLTNGAAVNGTNGDTSKSNFSVKSGLARMLKGGVIMDVVNAEQVCSGYSNTREHAHMS